MQELIQLSLPCRTFDVQQYAACVMYAVGRSVPDTLAMMQSLPLAHGQTQPDNGFDSFLPLCSGASMANTLLMAVAVWSEPCPLSARTARAMTVGPCKTEGNICQQLQQGGRDSGRAPVWLWALRADDRG